MIRYLEEQEKGKSRELWAEAFPEDSEAFDDYYFAEKLKDNRILVRQEDERLVSMIQLNPYLVQAAGQRWKVDYLVGVATRKDCRHRGYMRSLLLRMMADMRRERMPFCFLMPADEAIYRPFGFTYIFDQPSWRLRPEAEQELVERELTEVSEAAGWMNRWLQARYEVFAVRDLAYIKRLLKELASEKGSLRLLYDQEHLAGMISDWGLEKREQRLLYCQEEYVQEAAAPRPAIMARIITPEVFVGAVRLEPDYPEAEAVICLRLSDPLIAENDGWWEWHLGRDGSWMKRLDGKNGRTGTRGGGLELALTVTELTEWLFGYRVPESVGALEAVVRPLQGVFLDEIV